MSEIMRGYYCDYCGRELTGDEVTYDERHEACGNLVGGQYAGRDHVRIRELETQAEIAEAAVEWLKIAGWLGDRDEDGDAEDRAFCRLCQLAAPAARKEVE